MDTFKCDKCLAVNFITANFQAKKIEDVTEEDVEEGFINTTNADWTDEQIKKMCAEKFKDIKGM